MKKPKSIKHFSFKGKTYRQVADDLNDKYPISLKYNEDLVARVHARYPIIDKSKVGVIVKAIFSGIRDLLVLGKILNFHGLFFDTKFLVFRHKQNGVIYPAIKVKLSTPPPLRKI